jgi:voltage-gated potassium channel Kch
VAEAILAILDNDISVLAVSDTLRWYLHSRIFFHEGIGIRTFSAFYSHGIIVDRHIAVLYQHVFYHVKVDGIRGRTFCVIGLAETVDAASEELHVLGVIDVVCPESGVLEVHTLNLNILAVGDIDESGTLLVLVSAGFVPFSTEPELLMIL